MEGSPSIAEKLARLAALESDFQRLLEEEKLEAMAEFAAGAGHEINNPLTVISGRAQLLLREETDPERQRTLALIVAQAMRVNEMIADMMLFARPPKPEFAPVDLTKLVDDLVTDFGARCADRQTTIRRSGTADAIVLDVDAVQVTVALRAICQNALESVGRGGHIEMAVARADGAAQICVSDDGPGISPDQRRHIFDPFYSARQAGRGLGLGLSKAWRIIAAHGGRIDVSSEPGRTSFLIRLPARSDN